MTLVQMQAHQSKHTDKLVDTKSDFWNAASDVKAFLEGHSANAMAVCLSYQLVAFPKPTVITSALSSILANGRQPTALLMDPGLLPLILHGHARMSDGLQVTPDTQGRCKWRAVTCFDTHGVHDGAGAHERAVDHQEHDPEVQAREHTTDSAQHHVDQRAGAGRRTEEAECRGGAVRGWRVGALSPSTSSVGSVRL
jgi:hypothetical protein